MFVGTLPAQGLLRPWWAGFVSGSGGLWREDEVGWEALPPAGTPEMSIPSHWHVKSGVTILVFSTHTPFLIPPNQEGSI